MRAYFLLGCTLLMLAATCGKRDALVSTPVHLLFTHSAGVEELVTNTLTYENQAGNRISINRLQYFISEISLSANDGRQLTFDSAHLVDLADTSSYVLNLGMAEQGEYNHLHFYIGLTTTLNQFGALKNEVEINNMFWPEQMGGGYHFLKLEGHFLDTDNVQRGYAMHLGTDATLVEVDLPLSYYVNRANAPLVINMDVLQWLSQPNIIDLQMTNYSMGDDELMALIAKNGEGVFSVAKP